jgi:hypothetical protein
MTLSYMACNFHIVQNLMSERTGGGKSHGRLVKIRQIPSFPDKHFMSIIKIILKILNHEKSL